MRVVVLGAGAVGSLFGARLAGAGNGVTLVGRPAHVAAIQEHGLEVEGIRPGRFRVDASDHWPAGTDFQAVFLTVKTFDLVTASAELASGQPTPVPTLVPQNGLGVEDLAATGLRRGGWEDPGAWLVRAIHSVPATLLGAGRVRQAGEGEILLPRDAGKAEPALRVIAPLVESMGYVVRRLDEFPREVWRKAAINGAINPVTADHGILNGRLREEPWRGQSLMLLEEARRVAEAEGFSFSARELEDDLWRVVRATAENRSSMLQDVERGRPTEVDQISGEILRRGEAHGLTLPATRRAVDRLSRPRPSSPTGPPAESQSS
ncbi:MAG TPA: 2-dehydropantoate 2-reductase [Thermoplasmata archaeon]|nr:2-dehydropantoate 2-reductase [Thermoplasmata archaeon]